MKLPGWALKRQTWSFGAELMSIIMTLLSLALLKPAWALGWAILSVLLAVATRKWANQDPMPIPYVLHCLMLGPRPFQSPKRLKELLGAYEGARLLEVGPAAGKYSLPVSASLGSGGILEVLDIQSRMFDRLMDRASRAGITNIVPTVGDASKLPYPDSQFDGAYLITVLGEIPNKDAALRELYRVLKPEGYLIVGELFVDPDFISLGELRRHLDQVGFAFERKIGPAGAYLARFRRTK